MTRKDLVERLKEKFPEIEKEDLKEIISSFFEIIKEELKKGNRIELRGFGVLYLKKNKGLIFKNPKNLQKYYVKNKIRAVFKIGKEFKERLNAPYLASIDLGTQTFRICLGKFIENEVYFILRKRENVRLGEGLIDGNLSQEVIEKGLETLGEFKKLLEKYEVYKYRAVGTAIFRLAKNSQEFIQKAKTLGIDIEVITPEEEANLTLKGVIYGLKKLGKSLEKLLIVDVGGGSTEFIYIEKDKPKWIKSLEIGAMYLKNLFELRYPLGTKVLKSIKTFIADQLKDLPLENIENIVITGGTASLIGSLDLKLSSYQPDLLHGHIITKEKLEKLIKKLSNSDLDTIAKIKGMEKGREDIALPGILIYEGILNYYKKNYAMLSIYGILEGTLLSLI